MGHLPLTLISLQLYSSNEIRTLFCKMVWLAVKNLVQFVFPKNYHNLTNFCATGTNESSLFNYNCPSMKPSSIWYIPFANFMNIPTIEKTCSKLYGTVCTCNLFVVIRNPCKFKRLFAAYSVELSSQLRSSPSQICVTEMTISMFLKFRILYFKCWFLNCIILLIIKC